MAKAIQVGGACLIRTGTASAAALEDFGYSINGVRIVEIPYYGDVPGDQNGGDEGPPIDVQVFGITHRITAELSYYDATAMADMSLRVLDGTFVSGDLMLAGTNYFRVLLTAANFTRNYLYCIVREPIELNVGTKFTRPTITWEAHYQGGVIWNTTTSG